jgi:hypothetical protein
VEVSRLRVSGFQEVEAVFWQYPSSTTSLVHRCMEVPGDEVSGLKYFKRWRFPG